MDQDLPASFQPSTSSPKQDLPDSFQPVSQEAPRPQMNFAVVNKQEVPVDQKETGIGWLNNFIRPRIDQLAGKESGILNSDPNQNPLIGKSFLPETAQDPGFIGMVRHGIYEHGVRPLFSPLGILGGMLDANPPKEPIPAVSSLEAPPASSAVAAEVKPPAVTPEVKPVVNEPIPELASPNWKTVSDHLNTNPAIASGDAIKPSIDTINTSIPPQSAVDAIVPRGGQAKGIAPWEANFRSPHKVLLEHPETAPIAEAILKANDTKPQWIRSTLTEATQYIQGLDKVDRVTLGKLLDGQNVVASPDLMQSALEINKIIDAVRSQLPRSMNTANTTIRATILGMTKSPDDISSGIRSILSNTFGENSGFHAMVTKETLGSTVAPKQTNLEYDINRVLPAFLESAAKTIFDRPAIDEARKALEKIPKSNLSDLAAWYIKNYARYDSEHELHQAWQRFANQLGALTARSVVDFNPGLHMLHLGELPANIFPELGPKYTAYGIAQFAKTPLKTWTNMANLGLLQNEIKPLVFKTLGDKYQSAAYFMSYIESLVKGIGFYGAKRRFIDSGMDNVEAELQALRLTKDMTMTVDPARQMKMYSPESNVMGGEVGSRLGGQFKGIPTKIVEQYMEIASNAIKNPTQAKSWFKIGYGIAGGLAAEQATEAGLHMFHVNPSSLATLTALGPFGTAMGIVLTDLKKGDWQKALVDSGTWLAPAGRSIKSAYKFATED